MRLIARTNLFGYGLTFHDAMSHENGMIRIDETKMKKAQLGFVEDNHIVMPVAIDGNEAEFLVAFYINTKNGWMRVDLQKMRKAIQEREFETYCELQPLHEFEKDGIIAKEAEAFGRGRRKQ